MKRLSAKALYNALQSHTVGDLMRDSPNQSTVVEITAETSPLEALNTLWENNIIGAPVWDAEKSTYIGFLDLRDMLGALTAGAKASLRQGKEHTSEEYECILMDHLEKQLAREERDTKGGNATAHLATRNPFLACKIDSPLETIGGILTQQQHRSHRVPVVDSTGRCVYICSQSALVKFLSKKVDATELDEDLPTSGIPYKKAVISVLDTSPANEAFGVLDAHKCSGIAVVDDDGKLLGNTSARDIKLAACNKGGLAMDTDILTYLSAVRQTATASRIAARYPSCHVYENDCTVGKVIRLLAKTGYHRVFVVDDERKPVGVVSVSDIVRFAIEKGSPQQC